MQYTLLGKTGITVSRICLGCMSYGGGELPEWSIGTRGWHVNREDAREHFKIAIDSGINFFDTADVYSVGLSEEITGEYLNEIAPDAGLLPTDPTARAWCRSICCEMHAGFHRLRTSCPIGSSAGAGSSPVTPNSWKRRACGITWRSSEPTALL